MSCGWHVVVRDIELKGREDRLLHEAPEEILPANKDAEVVVLGWVAGTFQPIIGRLDERSRLPSEENKMEAEGRQPFFEPAEVVLLAAGLKLVCSRRNVNAIHNQ